MQRRRASGRRTVRRGALVVGVVLVVGALAGCGVGDPERPASGAAAATDGPAAADGPAGPDGPEGPDGPDGTTAGRDAPPATGEPSPPSPTTTEPDIHAAAVDPAPPAPGPDLAVPPRAGRSPVALADQLVHAEHVVRDPAVSEARVARQARIQQVAYRELALHPSWLDPVLDLLPEPLRDDALAHVAARGEFLDMAAEASLAPGPPEAWRVEPPAPAADLLAWYRGAGREYGVDWELLAAINLVETGLGRIHADSVAGAQGPMQFMPATWARWGHGDVHDPRHAIYGAARYLAASGAAEGRIDDAVFAYNHDTRYVRAVNLYAGLLRRTPLLFRALHHWQVYYRSAVGDLLLPEGYPTVPAAARP